MRRILLAFVVVLLTLSVGAFCVSCGIPSDTVIMEGSGSPLNTNLFRADDTPAEIRYTVSFSTGTSEVIDSLEVLTLSDSQVPIPSNNYKLGYRFEGWYLASDFSGSALTFPYTFSRNTILYAKWMANTTIRIENVEQLL
ncbi:MAG: InlB B-repeat-containing protein, partial [Clostridia bacterium]